jgi:hypothetical protein
VHAVFARHQLDASTVVVDDGIHVPTESADEIRQLRFTSLTGNLHSDAEPGCGVDDTSGIRSIAERRRSNGDRCRHAILLAGGHEGSQHPFDLTELRLADPPVAGDVVTHSQRRFVDARLGVSSLLEGSDDPPEAVAPHVDRADRLRGCSCRHTSHNSDDRKDRPPTGMAA